MISARFWVAVNVSRLPAESAAVPATRSLRQSGAGQKSDQMLFDTCSIWNMCPQRRADRSFLDAVPLRGSSRGVGVPFGIVFICEGDRRREHFSGPGSHARALWSCQLALASAHIKVVFLHISPPGFLIFFYLLCVWTQPEPELVRLTRNGCDHATHANLQQPWEHKDSLLQQEQVLLRADKAR